jgi:hypothetical protein
VTAPAGMVRDIRPEFDMASEVYVMVVGSTLLTDP